jgi:hypothetical protein
VYATLLFSMAMYAMSFLLMIQVQTVLGYSPLLAGIAYLPYAAHVLPGMLILSVGNGLSLPVTAVAAVDGTTEQDAGFGSALFTSVLQIGGAVGVAAPAIMGYSGGLTAGAVCVALGAVLIVMLLPSRASGPPLAGHGAGDRSTPTAAPRL